MDLFDAYLALSEAHLDEAPERSADLSPFCLGDRWGYVDKDGYVVIEPELSYATAFSEGVAAIFNEDGWGYIDEDGVTVYQERYRLGRKAN